MVTIRPAAERGHANHGWLDSRFSFSFADYYDSRQMGFRALRVINEDYVAPGTGFGKHPHRDMEIFTYVLEGAVKHQDTTGASETLVPGELQHMTAGSGVQHSEMNPSETETLHLLQIWLIPNAFGIAPRYEQKRFAVQDEPNKLHLLASTDARDGSFRVHADAELLAAKLEAGGSVTHGFRLGNGWLQVARGSVEVAGKTLTTGDGLQIEEESSLTVTSQDGGEFLLFDLK
ncbi:pirin family protein [Granulicella sp. WH15]|uniref:pirin family protein n=1 Tax=Granulicella sp. WH15 TaxID=2602070 RepID=UPI001366BE87|nr:pirin family protein [Granulicella sp. WH15]QHN02448.1 pirin family protein [Granulicella sp. WH15]